VITAVEFLPRITEGISRTLHAGLCVRDQSYAKGGRGDAYKGDAHGKFASGTIPRLDEQILPNVPRRPKLINLYDSSTWSKDIRCLAGQAHPEFLSSEIVHESNDFSRRGESP
jgi:hypothetical protein